MERRLFCLALESLVRLFESIIVAGPKLHVALSSALTEVCSSCLVSNKVEFFDLDLVSHYMSRESRACSHLIQRTLHRSLLVEVVLLAVGQPS